MLLRCNALARGNSGIRRSTLQTLLDMLNAGVHPIVPEQGSLGASGDLAPLAHIALVMMGEGEAEYGGERLTGAEAMRRARIPTVELAAKEGLALINGTQIMGPMLFDYGYGPFRWVCLSGKPADLHETDKAAMECIDPTRRFQDRDNWIWIRDAEKNKLVVGTQARILYQDAAGRVRIALRFNELVREGKIGPVMIGRDHHDVSGTDSPFRETANIKDGSNVMGVFSTSSSSFPMRSLGAPGFLTVSTTTAAML